MYVCTCYIKSTVGHSIHKHIVVQLRKCYWNLIFNIHVVISIYCIVVVKDIGYTRALFK